MMARTRMTIPKITELAVFVAGPSSDRSGIVTVVVMFVVLVAVLVTVVVVFVVSPGVTVRTTGAAISCTTASDAKSGTVTPRSVAAETIAPTKVSCIELLRMAWTLPPVKLLAPALASGTERTTSKVTDAESRRDAADKRRNRSFEVASAADSKRRLTSVIWRFSIAHPTPSAPVWAMSPAMPLQKLSLNVCGLCWMTATPSSDMTTSAVVRTSTDGPVVFVAFDVVVVVVGDVVDVVVPVSVVVAVLVTVLVAVLVLVAVAVAVAVVVTVRVAVTVVVTVLVVVLDVVDVLVAVAVLDVDVVLVVTVVVTVVDVVVAVVVLVREDVVLVLVIVMDIVVLVDVLDFVVVVEVFEVLVDVTVVVLVMLVVVVVVSLASQSG
mmetsp:Transcript_52531/g.159648  ORF Transcript_52531/g.159648 Transcript_52531/m.159648 type:complete len:380 (-) Transcript_52531:3439-4578(-)